MSFPTPSCCDTEWQLIYKILLGLPEIGGGSDVEAGSHAISNGASSVSVVFPTPFASAPVVNATVMRPAGNNNVYCDIDTASVTVLGFTATLSSAAPNGNYKLNWIATLAS
jgi:hypothetical protein